MSTTMNRQLALVLCLVLGSCTGSSDDGETPPAESQATHALATSSANFTFSTGSLVIPMDITHQDTSLFKAYGLAYRLLQNNIQVSWVIKPNKSLCTATTSAGCVALGDAVADFTVAAKDFVTNAAINPTHRYRGGPFVIDASQAAAAGPIITAFNTPLAAAQKVKVHVTTAPFTGFVKRQLVVAPSIAMFADGNEGIAVGYLNAAGIPDSQGNAWPNTSPDLLSEAATAGPSCTGASECKGTPHNDGKLFDGNGNPAYCQMMSMHYGINDADTNIGREVVREYRAFLQFPVHLFAECQAVNAIENNTNAPFTIAASSGNPALAGASQSGTTATFTTTTNHDFKVGEPVKVAGVGVAGYNGTHTVTSIPAANKFTATLGVSGLGNSGNGTARNFNGLFLTTTGYNIGIQPAAVTSLNGDQPFAQFDGVYDTTGGSEKSYSIPPGGGYKAQDVVMLTESTSPVGTNDVWMTGFLDGQCNTLAEFCDPQFAQGKVSYLGGHDYGTSTPLSNGDSQGTRMFLNALFEAPCATDLGAAAMNIVKTGPLSTTAPSATYTLQVVNTGSSVAGGVVITDTLAAGVAFVPAASQRAIATITRNTNSVTATTSTAHGYAVGNRVIVTGVTNTSFDGTFTITAVTATTFSYAQTGVNASSSGGRVALATAGICIGSAAQCGGAGGGVVTWSVGSVGGNQSTAVTLDVAFTGPPAKYNNTANVSFKAGNSTIDVASNTITTCFYATDPTICAGGGDPDAPACANGTDDDGDGLIDFPDDPGCDSAVDANESDSLIKNNKARVLVVFDTSGSMMWNTCNDTFTGGDGSQSCPGADVAQGLCNVASSGNGQPDDSRLFKVKAGLSNVINAFGEVEWGLMRFKQLPVPFSCGSVNVNKNDGGWQGAGASPCSGFAAGELVVKFDSENINSMLAWMDGSTNYPTSPAPIGRDFELRGSGNTPLGGSLASARTLIQQSRATDDPAIAGCRPYRVILVTDGAETCAGDPIARATELFAATDPDGKVPVHVIGFATPDQAVKNQLDQIANAGGTTSFVEADDEVELSAAIQNIVAGTILTEKCNDLDDDCDSKTDEDFPDKGAGCNNGAKGVCARQGIRVCAGNGNGTVCNAQQVSCIAGRLKDGNGNDLGPCSELCNNADDDCDGTIDEGLSSCNCQALPEICNGIDDDCNGVADDGPMPGVGDSCGLGVGACTLGTNACINGTITCSAPQPGAEVCNNIDDDCDSFTDEGATACYPANDGGCVPNGSGFTCKGLCRSGLSVCVNGGSGPCENAVVATTEVCGNGLDDDCDGTTDEGFPDLGDPCSNNQQGACAQGGQLVCDPNDLTTPNHYVCSAPQVTPGIEVCNAADDDCDGTPDNNLPSPPFGAPCGGGSCGGVLTCLPNGTVDCVGQTCNTPGCVELCNGLDDDCDSTVDEGATSDGTTSTCTDCCIADCCVFDGSGNCLQDCTAFQDIGQCDFGNIVCQAGGMACVDYVGPTPEVCDGLDNDCDGVPDDDAQCPSGTQCLGGQCVFACFESEFPCPFGFICKDIPDCGQSSCKFCVPDPCNTVDCPSGMRCDPNDGQCHDVCMGVMCPTGTLCFDGVCQDCTTLGCGPDMKCVIGNDNIGACEPDLCANVQCAADEFCNAGTCTPAGCDPQCPDGMTCFQGACIDDACANVGCPTGFVCKDGQCATDPCAGSACGRDHVCDPNTGECIVDPCIQVVCPTGTECELTRFGVDCVTPDDGSYLVTTGGGGGCSTGGGQGGLVLIAFGLLAGTRRRRAVST